MIARKLRCIPVILTVGLALALAAACGGDDDDDGGTTTDGKPTPGTSGSNPTVTSAGGAGSGSADPGRAAESGTGRLEVGGKKYDLTVTECRLINEGPTKGTVEAKGTGANGATFDFTQFVLNDKWSQTSMQYDYDGGAKKIYVLLSATSKDAKPATVNGSNVSWVASYRDLSVAANKQENLGDGHLNFTCK